VPSVAGEDYFEQPNRDRGENRSPQLAYVVISSRKIAARLLRRASDRPSAGTIPDYCYFAVGSAFNASDQLRALGALVTADWRGRRHALNQMRYLFHWVLKGIQQCAAPTSPI
jgi:hypothetical protein